MTATTTVPFRADGDRTHAETHWDLESLYRAHFEDAVRWAARITRDPDAARDVAQDAFIRMFSRVRPLRDAAAIEGYLRRVVVNSALSRARSAARQRSRELRSAPDPSRPPPDDADGALLEAVQRLPTRQREVLVLRYWLDLPDSEIAVSLRCRQATVRSSAARGLASLRRELG